MNTTDDAFWNDLRKAIAADELEATDLQAVDPTDEVELIAAETLLQGLDEEQPERMAPIAATATPRRPASWHRIAKLAAATLLAPKLLLAATAATAIAVTALLLQNTTHSLPFQDAVKILMNEQAQGKDRETAQGRVFFSCIASILAIQDSQASQAAGATGAPEAMELVRAALRQTKPFAPTSFPEAHADLISRIHDRALPPAKRGQSLRMAARQAAYGIRALKAIALSGGPPGLMASNAAHLKRISDLASN